MYFVVEENYADLSILLILSTLVPERSCWNSFDNQISTNFFATSGPVIKLPSVTTCALLLAIALSAV